MEENNENKAFAQVPAKIGFWNSFKNFWLQPVKLELTPYQRKVFKEVHDFWNQEIYLEHGEIKLRKPDSIVKEAKEEPEIDINL